MEITPKQLENITNHLSRLTKGTEIFKLSRPQLACIIHIQMTVAEIIKTNKLSTKVDE